MTEDDDMAFGHSYNQSRFIGQRWFRIRELLMLYQSRGKKLSELVGPKHFGVSLRTLKEYCRRFDIAFSDYTPRRKKTKLKPETGAENE